MPPVSHNTPPPVEPAPTCDTVDVAENRCGKPAAIVFGVVRECGCEDTLVAYACADCDADTVSRSCRHCLTPNSCYRVEPVRLQVTA